MNFSANSVGYFLNFHEKMFSSQMSVMIPKRVRCLFNVLSDTCCSPQYLNALFRSLFVFLGPFFTELWHLLWATAIIFFAWPDLEADVMKRQAWYSLVKTETSNQRHSSWAAQLHLEVCSYNLPSYNYTFFFCLGNAIRMNRTFPMISGEFWQTNLAIPMNIRFYEIWSSINCWWLSHIIN